MGAGAQVGDSRRRTYLRDVQKVFRCWVECGGKKARNIKT